MGLSNRFVPERQRMRDKRNLVGDGQFDADKVSTGELRMRDPATRTTFKVLPVAVRGSPSQE